MMKSAEQDGVTPQIAQVDIGGVLYSKRQEKGITVKQASEMVKLSPRIIEQLETGRFDEIGTAVYVRGYLGLYAKALELDASKLIQLYNEQYPSETTVLKPAINQKGGAQQQIRRHSKVLSFMIAALAFAVLAYAYTKIEPLLLQNDGKMTQMAPKGEENPNAQVPDKKKTVVSDILTQTDGAQQLADEALKSTNRTVVTDSSVTDNRGQTAPPQIVLESTNDLPAVKLEEVLPRAVLETQLRIKFDANQECWIKMTDANKKVIVSDTYPAGKSVDVVGDFEYPLTIRTWRPDALQAFSINDKAIQLTTHKVSASKFVIKKP